jgi:hypothetical protein
MPIGSDGGKNGLLFEMEAGAEIATTPSSSALSVRRIISRSNGAPYSEW